MPNLISSSKMHIQEKKKPHNTDTKLTRAKVNSGQAQNADNAASTTEKPIIHAKFVSEGSREEKVKKAHQLTNAAPTNVQETSQRRDKVQ
jgi:hypothetical protein